MSNYLSEFNFEGLRPLAWDLQARLTFADARPALRAISILRAFDSFLARASPPIVANSFNVMLAILQAGSIGVNMKLLIIALMAGVFGWLLCYGAMKTAEQIVKPHNDRIEAMQ
jgi:hypothetical protein